MNERKKEKGRNKRMGKNRYNIIKKREIKGERGKKEKKNTFSFDSILSN